MCTIPQQEGGTRGFIPVTCPPIIRRPQPHGRSTTNYYLLLTAAGGQLNRGAYLERTPASFARGPPSDFTRHCSIQMSKNVFNRDNATGVQFSGGHLFSGVSNFQVPWHRFLSDARSVGVNNLTISAGLPISLSVRHAVSALEHHDGLPCLVGRS